MTPRVLHCIYDDPGNPWVAGGGAVRLRELYRRLTQEVDVTVVTGNYPGARDETVDGVRYQRLGAAAPYAVSRISYARAATRLLNETDFDIGVFDYSVYTPLRWPQDRPIGLTVHHLTGATAIARFGRLLGGFVASRERAELRRARCISVTSQVTERQVREIVGPEVELVSVAAGVPDDMFQLERREGEHLLYFGRLDWFQKGLDTLLETMAVLVRTRPTLHLDIAGRGKDQMRAQAYAQDLGIAANITFLGPVSDSERKRLLAGARVLLMPSRFEGFGMVAAEAMAAGVPLVATAAGSLPEVVAPPDGGLLVPPNDAAAMARAVADLLDDDGARAALSRSARASAERFRWEVVARQHLGFLDRIRQIK